MNSSTKITKTHEKMLSSLLNSPCGPDGLLLFALAMNYSGRNSAAGPVVAARSQELA